MDFQRCYRLGRRRHGDVLVVHFAPNGADLPRFGITATRKVGGSVIRHRLKRQIREIYRRWQGRKDLRPLDFVVHLKPVAASATFSALRADLLSALSRLPTTGESGA